MLKKTLAVIAVGLLLVGTWVATIPASPMPVESVVVPDLPLAAPAENAVPVIEAANLKLVLPREGKQVLDALNDAARAKVPDGPGVTDFLAKNRALLSALGEARTKPQFQGNAPPLTPSAKLPDFRGFQTLARMSVIAFRRELRAGHGALAVKHLTDVLHLGRRMTYAPGEAVITRMVGLVITDLALSAVQRERTSLLGLDASLMDELAADLQRMDGMERPIDGLLAVERDSTLRALRSAGDAGLDRPRGALLKWFGPALVGDVRTLADARIAAVSRRDFKGLNDMELALSKQVSTMKYLAVLHPVRYYAMEIADMSSWNEGRFARMLFTTEARFDGLRILVAKVRYAQDHDGTYPTSWKDLTTTYLAMAPTDPFLPGVTLRYEKGRVWSVGRDGVDQDGREVAVVRKNEDGASSGDLVVEPPESIKLDAQ